MNQAVRCQGYRDMEHFFRVRKGRDELDANGKKIQRQLNDEEIVYNDKILAHRTY
jgi:hypothetical protein